MTKGNWGKIRAFFDLQTEEGFTMKGFKLVEGINGLFVGFPSQKGNDDEYRDTIWADRELKDELSQLAIKEYGSDNDQRLTGLHETQSIDEFSYGVSDRGASIRIPIYTVQNDWNGYLEDRRPAGNADPYRIIRHIVNTLKILEPSMAIGG